LEKVIKERAKLGRLEHFDAKADALEEKEAALRTAGEARELARRTRASNKGTPLGDYLELLTSEIESDRETLERLTAELGIRRDRLKAFGAWAAEKLGRSKLNGQLTGYSPLSRLLELESLYLGITARREMWRALRRTLGNDVPGFEFEELGRRAERRAAEVEEHRLEVAEAALVTGDSKPVAATKAKMRLRARSVAPS
jgi:hypothetical protein